MLNVSQFIADHITGRQESMFAADIEANRDKLRAEIERKSVLVIGGAGTIGSSYIRAVLPFRPSKLVVVDISENGLTASIARRRCSSSNRPRCAPIPRANAANPPPAGIAPRRQDNSK